MTGPTPGQPPEVPVKFKANGPDLSVELSCGHAQFGAYTLRLWSPDGMTVVNKARGNFFDEEEDRFPLLKPAGANDDHILQCRTRVWLVQEPRKYSVFMVIKQGDVVLAELSDEDETDESTVVVELRARLVRK